MKKFEPNLRVSKKFNPALLVMQPREIPEVIESLKDIELDKYCFKGFRENEVCTAINNFVKEQSNKYTHFIISADDIIYDKIACKNVIEESMVKFYESKNELIVTGWCELYKGSTISNVSLEPLRLSGRNPRMQDYSFGFVNNLLNGDKSKLFTNYLISFCFSCIPSNLLMKYPMNTYSNGYASDHNFSYRYYNKELKGAVSNGNMFFRHLKQSQKKSYMGYWIVGKQKPEIIKMD